MKEKLLNLTPLDHPHTYQFGVQGYITHPKESNFLHNGIRIFYVSLYSIQRFLPQSFCHRSVPEELWAQEKWS